VEVVVGAEAAAGVEAVAAAAGVEVAAGARRGGRGMTATAREEAATDVEAAAGAG
jgi:hypothetical protein